VVALQAIGLSSASALIIALMIGFLSLLVIAAVGLFVMMGWEVSPRLQRAASTAAVLDYGSVLDLWLPLMAASAVFFQVFAPTGQPGRPGGPAWGKLVRAALHRQAMA
jgi:hypothetical protein